MILGWLNERVEVVEKCSMIMKNKNVYKMLVENMFKKKPCKKPLGKWKIVCVFFGNWSWRCELCLNWHPITSLDWPLGLQEVEASRISNTVCTAYTVYGLSALYTGCLYPPGDIPGTHFC